MINRIYHMTGIGNLPSILAAGAVLSKRLVELDKIRIVDIAETSIQERRARKHISIDPGGTLHDYVPFYFAPRSPMLYSIMKRNVPGCSLRQQDLLFIVSDVEKIISASLPYVFCNRNASLANAHFFNDFEQDFSQVDWNIMQVTHWMNTDEDGDRKARRAAEFLVRDKLPLNLNFFRGIGVYSEDIKCSVLKTLQPGYSDVPVMVKKEYYFDD